MVKTIKSKRKRERKKNLTEKKRVRLKKEDDQTFNV